MKDKSIYECLHMFSMWCVHVIAKREDLRQATKWNERLQFMASLAVHLNFMFQLTTRSSFNEFLLWIHSLLKRPSLLSLYFSPNYNPFVFFFLFSCQLWSYCYWSDRHLQCLQDCFIHFILSISCSNKHHLSNFVSDQFISHFTWFFYFFSIFLCIIYIFFNNT